MRRMLLALCIAAAPLVLFSSAGCEQKVKTYSKTERVEQSEPQMVSPGEPVVE